MLWGGDARTADGGSPALGCHLPHRRAVAFTWHLPVLGARDLFPKGFQRGKDSPRPFCTGTEQSEWGLNVKEPHCPYHRQQLKHCNRVGTRAHTHTLPPRPSQGPTPGVILCDVGQSHSGAGEGSAATKPLGQEEPPPAPSPKEPPDTSESPASVPSWWVKPGLQGLQPPRDKAGSNPSTDSSSQRRPEAKLSAELSASGEALSSWGVSKTRSAFEQKQGHPAPCLGACSRAAPLGTGHEASQLCLAQGPKNCWGKVSELNYAEVWAETSPELLQQPARSGSRGPTSQEFEGCSCHRGCS